MLLQQYKEPILGDLSGHADHTDALPHELKRPGQLDTWKWVKFDLQVLVQTDTPVLTL